MNGERSHPAENLYGDMLETDDSARASAAGVAAKVGDGREETSLERVDRNMEELNGELRVVVTLGFAALSAACTIAPSARHRFLFRYDDKPQLVFSSNRVVIAGLSFLALAMCGSLLLVATKLFGAPAGVLVMALGGLTFGVLWFVIPIQRRRALDDGTRPSGSLRPR
jgi:hypothetical protein